MGFGYILTAASLAVLLKDRTRISLVFVLAVFAVSYFHSASIVSAFGSDLGRTKMLYSIVATASIIGLFLAQVSISKKAIAAVNVTRDLG